MTLPGATTRPSSYLAIYESYVVDTLTIYNPVRAQCDADPLTTASNRRINTARLRSGTVRWMALSRDFLSRWGGRLHYGDTLRVDANDPAIDGHWILQDTMHKRFHKRGDLLFDRSVRASGRWTNVSLRKRIYYVKNPADTLQ
jgi:hypothetical protein